MFNLFKLAFTGRNRDEGPEKLPVSDLSFSIFRNYQRRAPEGNPESAADLIDAEMRSLEDTLRLVDRDKQYELICAALRRIDKGLK